MQNVYTDYIESKGYTVQECYKPAKKEVPASLRDRYSSYEEYQEAMADFLNGMWFFPSNRPFVINNMFDELWSEINDMPGEIFDIPEMKDLQEDDNKSLEDFLKTNNDSWGVDNRRSGTHFPTNPPISCKLKESNKSLPPCPALWPLTTKTPSLQLL